MAASLKNFAKLLFSRSVVTKTAKIENKHVVIKDAKLRSLCERLEQSAKDAKQLEDECNVFFAVKKAFPTGRIIWLGLIMNLARQTLYRAEVISETRKKIKHKESQLVALRTKKA